MTDGKRDYLERPNLYYVYDENGDRVPVHAESPEAAALYLAKLTGAQYQTYNVHASGRSGSVTVDVRPAERLTARRR